MAATLPEIVSSLIGQIRDLRNGVGVPIFGRRSAATPASIATPTAWGGTAPTLVAAVGPSGKLDVTVTARLTATGGTTPRTLMGYALTGPYLDEAATTAPSGVTPATIAPSADRALTVVAGELAASLTASHTGLAPGWWVVTAQYLTSAASGSPTGTAAARQIVAAPL